MTPAITLTFRHVIDSVGPFQNVYDEITRPGADGHKFKLVGTRGSRQRLSAHQFYPNIVAARAGRLGIESAQGNEVFVYDKTRLTQYQVFLHSVIIEEPRAIVSTIEADTYILRCQLEITRTA